MNRRNPPTLPSYVVIAALMVQWILGPVALGPVALAQDTLPPPAAPLPDRQPGDLHFEIVQDPNHYEDTISHGLRPDLNGNVQLTPAQTDYWVGKEISYDNIMRKDLGAGTLVVMDFLNRMYAQSVKKYDVQAYQSLPQWESERLQTFTNRVMSEMYTKMDTLKNTSNYPTSEFDRTNTAIKLLADSVGAVGVPGTSVVADMAKITLDEMKSQYQREEGARDQRNTQEMLYDFKRRYQEIYAQSVSNGSVDFGYRYLWLKVFEPTVVADPWAPAKENFSRDRKFQEGLLTRETYSIVKKTLADNIDPKTGRLNVNIPELEKQLKGVQDGIIEHIDKSNAVLVMYLEGKERLKAQKEEEIRHKQEIFDSARSSVSLVSGILGFVGDRESARIVSGAGNAIIDAAVAIDKFSTGLQAAQEAGKVLMSCVNFAAAIGNIVGGLFSLFGGAKDPTQLILEAIQKLSEQITRLQKNMNDRFDQVDRNINRLFIAMQGGFDQVNRMLKQQKYDLDQIKNSLGGIQESLVRMDTALYSYLKAGFGERIIEETQLCLEAGPDMSLHEFQQCLVRFKTFATAHAADALAAGAPDALLGKSGERMSWGTGFFGRLADDLVKGLWENIGVLKGVVQYRYGDSSMRAPQNRPIVNAQDWALYVNRYILLVSQHPSLVRLAPQDVMEATNEILRAGDDTAVALFNFGKGSLAKSEEGKEATRSSALLQSIGDYESWLTQLQGTIQRDRMVYEQGAELKGYAINKPVAEQTPKYLFQPQEIRACPGYTIPSQNAGVEARMPIFAAPDQLEKLLPAPVAIAADLGLIQLDLCYSALAWANTESTYRDLTYQDYRSQIQFHIQFKYRDRRNPDSKPIAFSERRITASEKVLHWMVAYRTRWEQVPDPSSPFGGTKSEARRGDIAWAHGDVFVPPGHFSWREIASVDAWAGKENLASKFVAESVEALGDDQRKKALDDITAIAEKFLDQHRSRFDNQVRNGLDGGTDVYRVAQALSGSKELMESLIYLAFPKSMSGNDELHALFRGREAILDTLTIKVAHDDSKKREPLDPDRTNLYKDNAPKIEKLKAIVADLVNSNKGGEPHQVLESARLGLETLKAIQSKLVASVPISDALVELKSEVERLIRAM